MTSPLPSETDSQPLAARARDKVATIDDLAVLATRFKAQGLSVVLAHGVFDLVHMGPLRHLEEARGEGDVLFVTVTDRFVNKGPDRPVFTEQFRAEMLAGFECVDYVAVNRWPTAEEIIARIRPDVYVKGPDYTNDAEDLTGKISAEREAVAKIGGRIVFTDDITFSSSSLINRHFDRFEPEVHSYLNELRKTDVMGRMLSAIEAIEDKRVLLVGDAIIDEYQYAEPMGKSAKENIIASRFSGREVFAGGVIAAANHVASFCRHVEIITCLGANEPYEDLIRDSVRDNVEVHFVYRSGAPTTRKCRFVDPGHMKKPFEVYFFDDAPLNGGLEKELCDLIADRAGAADTVIVTDFGHGLMTERAIETVRRCAPFLAVNAQSKCAKLGYNLITKYPHADYVCIDAPEARLAVADRVTELDKLITEHLRPAVACDRIIVTHGEKGCFAYAPETGVQRIPAFTRHVVDTVGAGDAFLAVTAPIVAQGAPLELAGFIGNAVGALKVGIVGHRQSVEKIPLMKTITALLK